MRRIFRHSVGLLFVVLIAGGARSAVAQEIKLKLSHLAPHSAQPSRQCHCASKGHSNGLSPWPGVSTGAVPLATLPPTPTPRSRAPLPSRARAPAGPPCRPPADRRDCSEGGEGRAAGRLQGAGRIGRLGQTYAADGGERGHAEHVVVLRQWHETPSGVLISAVKIADGHHEISVPGQLRRGLEDAVEHGSVG
jgi:hypothetical protein